MAVLSHVFSVHKFTNEIYSKWQYITVQGMTDIGLFRSRSKGVGGIQKGNTYSSK
jgi:hypothetical protein